MTAIALFRLACHKADVAMCELLCGRITYVRANRPRAANAPAGNPPASGGHP